MKQRSFTAPLIALAVSISGIVTTNAAVTIAFPSSSATGGFTLSDKVTLPTTGEISVGFFTGTGPTATDWQNILQGGVANAWDSILGLGYKDVRTLSGASLATGFDPSFATKGSTQGASVPATDIGFTVQNIAFSSLPSGTRMYVMAFNGGTWDNATKTGTFGSATEFAVVSSWGKGSGSQNFSSPADNGTKSMPFSAAALVSTDVLIGSLNTDTKYVSMIPEPTTSSLILIGFSWVIARKRKHSSLWRVA